MVACYFGCFIVAHLTVRCFSAFVSFKGRWCAGSNPPQWVKTHLQTRGETLGILIPKVKEHTLVPLFTMSGCVSHSSLSLSFLLVCVCLWYRSHAADENTCCSSQSESRILGMCGAEQHSGDKGTASVSAGRRVHSWSRVASSCDWAPHLTHVLLLQSEYFNKDNAVLESLRRSERTKNLINTKASEGNTH